MKKLYLILFIGISFGAKGQTSVYHPFPDSNAVWNVHVNDRIICGFLPHSYDYYYSYSLNGDTTINGMIYHKLFHSPTVYISDCSSQVVQGSYLGGVKQDTAI